MSIAPEDHPDVDPPGVYLHHPGVFQDKRRIGVVLDRRFQAVHLACRLCRPRINCLLVRHVHIALMGALLVAISHSVASALAAASGQDPKSNIPPADTSGLNFHQFGLLAIQDGGRRKPIDTFARETLIRITGRSTYSDKAGRKWQPNDFVFSAALETHNWRDEPMVLVSLGQLKERLGFDNAQRRFSFEQLVASAELQRLTNEAHALKRAEKPVDRVQQEALSVSDRLALLANVMNGSALLIVPASKSETEAWVVPPEFSRYYSETQFAPVQIELQTMATSYVQADRFNFSRAASRLRESLHALSPSVYPQERQLRLEYFYNHFEAFYRAIWFYGLAFLILLVAHACGGGRLLRTVGVPIAALAIAFHASGIVMRCLIAGRPPVTNMYESIIWVSFAVSFFGMIFFARYRTSVYLLAALPVSLIALLLVHQMPIALLCYLTTLHGRLAGWWTEFGLVVASVVCFLAVLMAWYGVNFVLGKGLHSYGFGIGGETYVAIGVVLDLLFVAFAIWRYRSSKRTPSSTPVEAVAV